MASDNKFNGETERIAPQSARSAEDATEVMPAVAADEAAGGSEDPDKQKPAKNRKPLIAGIAVAVVAVVLLIVLACSGAFSSGDKSDSGSTPAATQTQTSTDDEQATEETSDDEEAAKEDDKTSAESSDKAAEKSSSSSSESDSGSDSGSDAGSSKNTPAKSSDDTITVTISIDGSRAGSQDSASMSSRTVTIDKGDSVFDALLATGASYSGNSTYVSAINGLAEKQCGALSGWQYMVDGSYPNKSCGKYVLSGGETIKWVYVLEPTE